MFRLSAAIPDSTVRMDIRKRQLVLKQAYGPGIKELNLHDDGSMSITTETRAEIDQVLARMTADGVRIRMKPYEVREGNGTW